MLKIRLHGLTGQICSRVPALSCMALLFSSCIAPFPSIDLVRALWLIMPEELSLAGPLSVGPVSALYPINGKNWNDYVKRDGLTALSASDTACAGTETAGYSACIHGGEVRVVWVTNRSSCNSLAARDELNALTWRCDESTGTVRFVSGGLKRDKLLIDLIDTASATWRANRLIISENGTDVARTTFETWWSNAISINPSPGSLASSTTVYVFTANMNGAYTITSDKISIAASQSTILQGPASNAIIFSATGRKFLWLEGRINASGDNAAYHFSSTNFSVIRNCALQSDGTNIGIELDGGSTGNRIMYCAIANFAQGLDILNSPWNEFLFLSVSNTQASYGIWIRPGSENTIIQSVTSASTAGNALNIQSPATIILNFSGAFAGNNTGIYFDGGVHQTIMNAVMVNNGRGLDLTSFTDANSIFNLSAAQNLDGADKQVMDGGSSSNHYFSGSLRLSSANCSDLNGGVNLGLDASCNPTGASDASVMTGVSAANSFVGKVSINDTVNSSPQAGGVVSFAAVNDWVRFENGLRMFVKDNLASIPDAGFQGPCGAGNCRIWDFSLSSTDTVLRNMLPLPAGSDVAYHGWNLPAQTLANCQKIPGAYFETTNFCSVPPFINNSSCLALGGTNTAGCYTRYLRNAYERLNDAIGNDNGLCESNEICVYTPNIGAYQGHGELTSAGTFADGLITNVTLLQSQTNGR